MAEGKNAPPVMQDFNVSSFRLQVAPPHNWESEVKSTHGYVLFKYTDKPALTTSATLGVFRIIVPAAARSGDRLELARAYATSDLAGIQQALFKSNADLRPMNRKAKALNGGQLFTFAEPLDASDARISSTMFTRGWVFFPADFATEGALYLLLGKQETPNSEIRPDELAWAEDIVAGIRPR